VLELLAAGKDSFDNSTISSSKSVDVQQLQQCCARALAYECSIRLLSCSTTVEQDEKLLKQLLQPANAAASVAGSSKNGVNKAKKGTKGFGSRAAQPAAVLNSTASVQDTEQQQQQQELIVVEDMQQQALQQLLVLQASSILKRGSSSSSSSSADAQAAQRVLSAVVLLPPPKVADLAMLQQQQLLLLQKLQERQQQQGINAAALLAREGLGLARVVAAVEARLERKRMLQLCADLCQQLALGLQ
jgi:hypothetical protein